MKEGECEFCDHENKVGVSKCSECGAVIKNVKKSDLDVNIEGNANVVVKSESKKGTNKVSVKGNGNVCISGIKSSGSIDICM